MEFKNPFVNWLAEPFKPVESNNSSEKIIIEEEVEPINPIVVNKPATSSQKKTSTRPQDFEGYIGQHRAKSILQTYIKSVKKRELIFPHILVHGKAGTGKTTIARIVANMLGVEFVEVLASSVTDFYQLYEIIMMHPNSVVFIDEIHAMNRNMVENLYTVMEDFTYNGEEIEQFTLMGATTELGEILKTRKPFFDRFKIVIELEDYTNEEIATIGINYAKKAFPEETLVVDTYPILAANARKTPRVVIRLVDATFHYDGDTCGVFSSFGIIKDGYTYTDKKVLEYLSKNEKGCGLQSLSAYLDTSAENYLYIIEPYLLQTALVTRTSRGRRITETGIQKLKELNDEIK